MSCDKSRAKAVVLLEYSRGCHAKPRSVDVTCSVCTQCFAAIGQRRAHRHSAALCCSEPMLTDILPTSQPRPPPSSPPPPRPPLFTTSCPEHHLLPSTTVLVTALTRLHHPRWQVLVLPPLPFHTFFTMQSSLHQYFPATKAGVCRPAKDDEHARVVDVDAGVDENKPNPFDVLPIEVCHVRCTWRNITDEPVPRR